MKEQEESNSTEEQSLEEEQESYLNYGDGQALFFMLLEKMDELGLDNLVQMQ